jgi:hypothetical protein
MSPRIGVELSLPTRGFLDVLWRDRCLLFHYAVRSNRGRAPMKEVQHSIIHAGLLGTQLVDAVGEVVGLRRRSSWPSSSRRSRRTRHFARAAEGSAANQPTKGIVPSSSRKKMTSTFGNQRPRSSFVTLRSLCKQVGISKVPEDDVPPTRNPNTRQGRRPGFSTKPLGSFILDVASMSRRSASRTPHPSRG